MGDSKQRTLGCDLHDDVAAQIFDDLVPAGHLQPRKLWAIKIQRVKGETSDWGACEKALPIMSALIDAGRGRIPHQACLHKQFMQFLTRNHCQWTYRECDDAITNLRTMLQSILELKRSPNQAPPKNHRKLEVLMDKLYLEGSHRNQSRSQSRRGSKRKSRSPCSQSRRGSKRKSRSPRSQSRRGRKRTSRSPCSQSRRDSNRKSRSPRSQGRGGRQRKSRSPRSQSRRGRKRKSRSPRSQSQRGRNRDRSRGDNRECDAICDSGFGAICDDAADDCDNILTDLEQNLFRKDSRTTPMQNPRPLQPKIGAIQNLKNKMH